MEVSAVRAAPTQLDVVWSRDGRGRPQAGTPGDVVVYGEDVFARFLRARTPEGASFIVEMQRDVVDPSQLPASWGPNVGNAAMHLMWRRRTLAAAAEIERRPGPSAGTSEHAPLFVCRERGAAFRPPSPHSANPEGLDECRSDDALRAVRLPAWSSTLQRFLYDPAEARTNPAQRFYAADPQPVRGATVDVGTYERLLRDLGRLLDLEAAHHPAVERLRGAFPCFGCPETPRCYARPAPGSSMAPPGPPLVGKRVAPVSMQPFRAVAHREEVVDFGEHCDLLGGAAWGAFRARHVARWTFPGRRAARELLERELAGRTEAVTPIAALAEKLKLFEAVVEEVAQYHKTHGRPHLALSPATIVSHRLSAKPGEGYDVSLRGALRAPVLDDLMPPPPGPAVWLVPPEAVAPYAHADVVSAAEPRATAPPDGSNVHKNGMRCGRSAAVRISVRRVWTDESKGTTEFELDVEGLSGAERELDVADRVRVEIASTGWENTPVWCRRDTERVAVETLPLRAFPVRLDSGKILDLKGAGAGKALLGAAVIHRTYGAYYDLHALGMLLLRAALDNSAQSVDRIAVDVVPSAVSFCRAVHDREGKSAWQELVGVFENLVKTPPLDGFLAQKNATFFPGERPAGHGQVPPRLWAEVLATAVACVTRGGVGFADGSRIDTDPARFTRPIDGLLSRVREIRSQIAAARNAAASAAPAPRDAPAGQQAPVDPRDARIRELEESLKSSAARMQRLQSDLDAASSSKARVERTPAPAAARPSPGDDALWRSLTEALAGPTGAARTPPRPDDEAVALVRTLLVEGLETLGTLGDAVAELGGQEFASEQKNLQRMVRQALEAAASGAPDAGERMATAMQTLRSLKTSLGATIGLLVEAHGRSTKDGTRRMILTLGVAVEKEIDLSKDQKAKLHDILKRMDAGLGELIARFYDPAFEEHLQRELRKRRAPQERRPR